MKRVVAVLVVLASMLGAASASASTVEKPAVISVAALPSKLTYHGGTVTIAAQLEHATGCRLKLLSHQGFQVVYASNWRPCTTALVAHATVGANPTPLPRTIALDLVARDGSRTTSRLFDITMAAKVVPPAPKPAPVVAITVSPTTLPASGGNVSVRYSSHGVTACTLTEVPTATNSSVPVPCNGTQVIAVPSTAEALSYQFTLSGTDVSKNIDTATATVSQAGPAPTTTTTNPAPPTTSPTGPTVNDYTSGNWSGYAVEGSGLTNVSGTFTVPTVYNTVQCNETVSHWVGVDGWQSGDNNLIQAGITESMTDPSTGTCGADVYYIEAWWEILPADEVTSSIPIEAGDSVTVTIWAGAPGFWDISLTDNTNGQGFNVQEPYSGPASSAEWITEAYTVNGTQTPIAPFSPVKWSGLQIPTSASVSEVDAITLQQGGNTEAAPSDVSSLQNLLGSGFTDTYMGGN